MSIPTSGFLNPGIYSRRFSVGNSWPENFLNSRFSGILIICVIVCSCKFLYIRWIDCNIMLRIILKVGSWHENDFITQNGTTRWPPFVFRLPDFQKIPDFRESRLFFRFLEIPELFLSRFLNHGIKYFDRDWLH